MWTKPSQLSKQAASFLCFISELVFNARWLANLVIGTDIDFIACRGAVIGNSVPYLAFEIVSTYPIRRALLGGLNKLSFSRLILVHRVIHCGAASQVQSQCWHGAAKIKRLEDHECVVLDTFGAHGSHFVLRTISVTLTPSDSARRTRTSYRGRILPRSNRQR